MSVTVELPDELADRLATAAAGRGETLEQLAVETLEATFPPRPGVSFIGIGASGEKVPTGRRHRELLRESARSRSPRDA
ncbi:MAG TPA: hypothetical protein VF109_03370 [Mycobacteriales bacterium]